MRKPLLLLTLFAAAVAAHASTCETRVDSHPCATTPQRVDYCLTPEAAQPQGAGPEVIYASVTTQTPEKETAEKTTPLKQKYYNEDNMFVRHQYVGSARFPQLKNDILSERELQAQQALLEETSKKEATQQHPARVMPSQTVADTQESSVSVNKWQKPARTMKEISSQETVVELEPTPQQALETPAPQTDIPDTLLPPSSEDPLAQPAGMYGGN